MTVKGDWTATYWFYLLMAFLFLCMAPTFFFLGFIAATEGVNFFFIIAGWGLLLLSPMCLIVSVCSVYQVYKDMRERNGRARR